MKKIHIILFMKNRMPDLSLLRSLLLVSETSSIEEAARSLGITQSALSYQLKRLEERLPTPVFTVEGRRKVLTHFGRALCDFAREETERLERGIESLERAYADPTHLTLRIACRRDRFVQVRNCIDFPGSIELLAASSDEALAKLRAHDADIAVCHVRPDVPGVVARPLFTSGPWVICHSRWLGRFKKGTLPWARDPRFLSETPLLAYQIGEAFITKWLRHCGLDPARVKIRLACQDWEALVVWVAQGEGYALVPGDLAENVLKRLGEASEVSAFAVPAAEFPPIPFYAVFHKDLRKTAGFGPALVIREAPK